MTVKAIGVNLDKAGVTVTRAFDDCPCRVVYTLNIGPVSAHSVQAKGFRAGRKSLLAGRAVHARPHAILVIDTAENDRQLP